MTHPLRKFLYYLTLAIGTTGLTLLLNMGLLTIFTPVQASLPPTQPQLQQLSSPTSPVEQGNYYFQAGYYTTAVKIWQDALEQFTRQGDELNQAMVLSNLALAYDKQGNPSQAEDAIAKSLNILQTTRQGNQRDRLTLHAQALNNRGTLELAQGNAQAALTTWKQAQALYEQVNHELGIQRSVINQSQALQAQGRYPQACNSLLPVFNLPNQTCTDLNPTDIDNLLTSLRQPTPTSPLTLEEVNRLGSLLRLIGNLELSYTLLERSLSVQPPTAATYFDLGNTAGDLSQRARDLYQRTGISDDFSPAKDWTTKALDAYTQAAQSASDEQLPAQLNRLQLLLTLESWVQNIKTQIDQQDPIKLLVSGKQDFPQILDPWLNQIQTQLASINPTALATAFSQLPPSYRSVIAQTNLAQTLIDAKTRFPNLSWTTIDQLLDTAEKNAVTLGNQRAQAYALGYKGYRYEQSQNWSKAQTFSQNALNLSQSLQAWDIAYRWSWQLGRIYQQQHQTENAIAAYQSAFDLLQTLRQDLTASAEDFRFKFREQVEEPVYRNLVDLLLESDNPSPQNLKQARQIMESLQIAELENYLQQPCAPLSLAEIDRVIEQQDPSAAFLYPIILPNRLELILKLPGEDQLYSSHTSIPEPQLRQTLQKFRQHLQDISSVNLAKTEAQKVYQWLIQPIIQRLDNHEIKTLVFVLDGSLRNIPLAALYDGEQYLIEKYAIAVAANLTLQEESSLSTDDFNVLAASLREPPPGFQQFAALPNVDVELNEIEKTGASLTALRDQQFTRLNFNQYLNQSGFPIIHLATHGKFSSNPEDTYILTADGKLTISELEQLFETRNTRQTDLVKLIIFSACETADGDERADLGIAGTLIKTGASSAVATLWSVDDEFSVAFMKEFYQHLGEPNITKAEALRRTQVTLLRQSQNKSPRYWAPYILIGSWL